VLGAIPRSADDRVLVDFSTSDDAGVYRWESGPALVQTVDFFTPIVDDPFVYGQIAAANAVSDIYAMGGRPLTALAIAAFPADEPGDAVIRQIFLGGLDKLKEAGVALLGGHTVRDQEIKFGYAVTGAVDPARILTNAGARPGDALLLTKPLGTGIIATALKFDRAPEAAVAAAVRSMTTLNRRACEALVALPAGSVNACTDVTGFGLIGHASEIAAASGCTIRIDPQRVPVLTGALALGRKNLPGGGKTNESHFGGRLRAGVPVDPDLLALLHDPQTSGGLLAVVSREKAATAVEGLRAAGVDAAEIGEALASDRDGALVELCGIN
jgi:selenide, water dikinase